MALSLSAKGLTHGEISPHLAEVYGAHRGGTARNSPPITLALVLALSGAVLHVTHP